MRCHLLSHHQLLKGSIGIHHEFGPGRGYGVSQGDFASQTYTSIQAATRAVLLLTNIHTCECRAALWCPGTLDISLDSTNLVCCCVACVYVHADGHVYHCPC